MARTAAAGFWSRGRACARTARLCLGGRAWLAAGLVLIGLTSSAFSQTEPVKGEATFSASGGYARLVLKLAEDVESQVSTAGSILVIRFKRPVDIPVDRLSDAVPDYVGSVRRDPDGSAIRLSLARKVTINTMTAGERVFVDLLPDDWSGQPPGLPAEVVRELVRARAGRRARVAPAARRRGGAEASADSGPRLGAADLRALRIRNARRRQRLQRAERPEAVAAVQRRARPSTSRTPSWRRRRTSPRSTRRSKAKPPLVEVALIGDVDVRSFREEKNYIIDVAFQQPDKPPAQRSPLADRCPGGSRSGAGRAGRLPRSRPRRLPASRPASEIVPPTSETFAQQAKIEIKPESGAEDRARVRTAAGPRYGDCQRQTPAPAAEAPPKDPGAPRIRTPAGSRQPAAASNPGAASSPGAAAGQAAAGRRRAAASVSARRDSDAPARDVRVCRGDAGGLVSSRRHGVAGVRFPAADRCRADPQPRAGR